VAATRCRFAANRRGDFRVCCYVFLLYLANGFLPVVGRSRAWHGGVLRHVELHLLVAGPTTFVIFPGGWGWTIREIGCHTVSRVGWLTIDMYYGVCSCVWVLSTVFCNLRFGASRRIGRGLGGATSPAAMVSADSLSNILCVVVFGC